MRFFDRFRRSKRLLVIDFGTGAIKGLIVENFKDDHVITKFHLEKIDKFGIFNAKNFQADVLEKTFGKVLKELDVAGQLNDFEVIVSLPSDILKAVVVNIALTRENETERINKDEQKQMRTFIVGEVKKGICLLAKDNPETCKQEVRVLKNIILETSIAGYAVSSALGFRGKKIDFSVLALYTFGEQANFIKESLKKVGVKNYQILHEAQGLIEFNKIKEGGTRRLFVDIGHNFTNIFIFDKSLKVIIDFKIGGSDFRRSISRTFGLTEQEADTILELFLSNQLSPGVKAKVLGVLAPVVSLWKKSFNATIKQQTAGSQIFLGDIIFFGGAGIMVQIQTETDFSYNKTIKEISRFRPSSLDLKDINIKNNLKTVLPLAAVPAVLLAIAKFKKDDQNK